jgi:hypothetical protein
MTRLLTLSAVGIFVIFNVDPFHWGICIKRECLLLSPDLFSKSPCGLNVSIVLQKLQNLAKYC